MPAPGARALDVLEAALDQPTRERDRWLEREHGGDAPLVAQVRRLLARDAAASQALPTQPAEPAPPEDEPPPPERVGAYRLTAPLGRGGMGVVYRAERDDGLFEHVAAAKLIGRERLDGRLAERFDTERRALARLNHPSIARLLDGGMTADGRPYLLMDLVEGRPITEAVVEGDLPPRAVVALVLQVCAATAAAHGKLVAHGDIKPSNVLVTAEGEVKLLDFGVARLIEAEEGIEAAPLTAAYASPQRRGGEPPSTADDVFALGVLLRELLERRGPTLGEGAARRVPEDLAAIAGKAAAAEADRRYPGADALAADLGRWLEGRAVEARGRSSAYMARRFIGRHPRAVAAAALSAVALALTAATTTTLYLQAEAARQEADRRFADARSMADYLLTDVFDHLAETPGSIGLRLEMVDRARRRLEAMTASPRAPADIKVDAALGYMRLAGVLGYYGTGQLGRRAEAERMLAEASRLLSDVPTEVQGGPRYTLAAGRLAQMQGFEALNRGDGDLAAARPHLERSARLLARAAAAAPADPEPLAELWNTRNMLADALSYGGDHAGAGRLMRTELAAWPARAAILADSARAPLLRSESKKLLGNALYYQGDKAGAAAAYRRAVAVLEAEAARRPGRSVTVAELMEGWWALATTSEELGDPAEGLRLLARALATARVRQAADPENEQLRRITSMLVMERAAMLARHGRAAEALPDAVAEVAARRRLAERTPGDLVLQRSVLAVLRPTADIRRAAGDPSGACEGYREALAAWQAYDRRHGLTPLTRDTELALIRRETEACGRVER